MGKFPTNNELEFNKFLVSEYLRCGTVDRVLDIHDYSLPVSRAQYHRILDSWGVIKAVGPNSKLVEAVEFVSYLAKENIPFDELYRRLPANFQTSAKTLYRILGYVKEGLTRRVGVALVITPFKDEKKVLLGADVSAPRIELGKEYGSMSIPMGYARKRDSRRTNIKRVLQQEVFSKLVVERKFPEEVVPRHPEPYMYLDIADIRVAVYHLTLTKNWSALKSFSSYKLKKYRFAEVEKITADERIKFRAGVKEAVRGYRKYLRLLRRNLSVNPLQEQSLMNKELAMLTVEFED